MADLPTVSINESSPAGSDIIALGDNKIREYKVQNREILEVDHTYPSSGQSATAGTHKKVTLIEQADLGTGATGVPILGAQTVSGVAELVFTTEANSDLQLTKGEYLNLDVGIVSNNVALKSKDNAGTGALDLIKGNTSDQAVVTPALLASGGAILPEITAPATTANQGALYTKNDGTQTELYFREESNGDEVQITKGGALNAVFGSWVDKSSSYGAQQASTDGFVIACMSQANVESTGTAAVLIGKTDSAGTPTVVRGYANTSRTRSDINGSVAYAQFCMPVKKSEYWSVTYAAVQGSPSVTITVYWIPLGS